jgi:hypothetical protein
LTVGAEHYLPHDACAGGEGWAKRFAAQNISQTDCAILAAGSKDIPIRAEGHALYGTGITLEGWAGRFAAGHVPEPDRAAVTAGSKDLPVGLKAMPQTKPVCPESAVPSGRWRATSQNWMVSAVVPAASIIPSGLKAMTDGHRARPPTPRAA